MGLGENQSANGLSVYPNPTNGLFMIQYSGTSNIQEVFIRDVNARIIEHYDSVEPNEQLRIQAGPGIYFVEVLLENGESEIIRVSKR